ncbi:MAG: TrkA family potassium uptake protein [Anaerolineaceae bacterium]
MFVVIAGGGRTGTHLAKTLLQQNHEVHIIEDRRDILGRMHHELPTENIFEGNPVSPEILEDAGIQRAQVLAAVTTSDAENLAVCYYAREKYKVPRTIARVNNPRDSWLFDKKFNVDVAINQTELMAHIIEEEMSMGDMMTLLKLRRGNYSLVEEKVPPGAKAIGVPIREMGLPDHCVVAAIIRHGEVIVPRGSIGFEAGDEVLAVTDTDGAKMLGELLAPVKK